MVEAPKDRLASLLNSPGTLDKHLVASAASAAHHVQRLADVALHPIRVVVPAAGLGTRFSGSSPKVLAGGPRGRPLVLRVLDALSPFDQRPVVVLNPGSESAVRSVIAADGTHRPAFVVQRKPRGMGDALLCAELEVASARRLLVAWGDMGAICTGNAVLLVALHQSMGPSMTFVTKRKPQPYVAIVRDEQGRVVDVLLRRSGDALPEVGESDCGLFCLDRDEIFEGLRARAGSLLPGSAQLDLLPLVRDLALAARPAVAAAFAVPEDSQGVNTLAELDVANRCLAALEARALRSLPKDGGPDALLHRLLDLTITPAVAQAAIARIGDHASTTCPTTVGQAVLKALQRVAAASSEAEALGDRSPD